MKTIRCHELRQLMITVRHVVVPRIDKITKPTARSSSQPPAISSAERRIHGLFVRLYKFAETSLRLDMQSSQPNDDACGVGLARIRFLRYGCYRNRSYYPQVSPRDKEFT